MTAAEDRSSGVLQAAATLDIQQQEIQRSRAANSPAVDVVASLSNQRYSNSDLNQTSAGGKNATIGVQLTMPLWDSGMRNSRVRQAVAGADQAHEDLQTARRNAEQSARQSFIGVTTAIAQAQALEQATASAQSSLDATLRGREVGYRTAIDVLNARQLLFQTRRQMAAVRYTAIVGLLQLKAITGGLTEWDLDGLTSSTAASGPAPPPSWPSSAPQR